MAVAHKAPRFAWIEGASNVAGDSLLEAVEKGLQHTPRSLPCRFLYDAQGSELFEKICDLPEYYVTRAEHEILRDHADDIAARCPRPSTLAELGSGSSTKTRLLIEAFLRRQERLRYVPVDISHTMLDDTARSLIADYESLDILAIASEYREGLRHVGRQDQEPKLIAWLGSNIGNFSRPEASAFLQNMREAMGDGDQVLLGVDLRKDAAVLESAYDDAAGVTARFNKNLLARINRELSADFELAHWTHRARVVDDGARVELGLVSLRDQQVRVGALEREYGFEEGEFVHTEDSAKYSPEEIGKLADSARFTVLERWLDAGGRFSLNLLSPR